MLGSITIAPSMMESDLTRVARVVAELEAGGVGMLHVDVGDAHFVPNLMIGPYLCAAICRCATVPVSTHLMITDPVAYAPAYAEAGSDVILFHQEAVDDLPAAVTAVKELGVEVGIAIKPGTPIDVLAPVIGRVDCLLPMTVEPGFSGQGFMEEGCAKIPALREMFGSGIDIYVDGGIGPKTVATAVGYGANVLVAGSAVFHVDVAPPRAAQGLQAAALEAAQRT